MNSKTYPFKTAITDNNVEIVFNKTQPWQVGPGVSTVWETKLGVAWHLFLKELCGITLKYPIETFQRKLDDVLLPSYKTFKKTPYGGWPNFVS